MKTLQEKLDNIKKDDKYQTIITLKQGSLGCTEKVQSVDGVFIRKTYPYDSELAENELAILSQLDHPAIPKIVECYKLSGTTVIIEEYIVGDSLAKKITENGKLSIEQTIIIIQKLCDVVHYLHTRAVPIIHRDIKPDNIICTNNGEIKLIDFGISRNYKTGHTKDTVYFGTVGYVPPEQFGFGQTDIRADIYAIGMTMLHMLTGVVPDRGTQLSNNESIPAELFTILRQATEFDPKNRFKSVTAFRNAIVNARIEAHPNETKITQRKVSSAVPNIQQAKAEVGKQPEQGIRKQPEQDIRKQAQAKNAIFPRHCGFSARTKKFLLPVHILLILTFITVPLRDIFAPVSDNRLDNVLTFLTDFFMFSLMVAPTYIAVFNFFNINERIKYLHKHRLAKKILICFVIFVIGGLITSYLNQFHTPEYLERFPTS